LILARTRASITSTSRASTWPAARSCARARPCRRRPALHPGRGRRAAWSPATWAPASKAAGKRGPARAGPGLGKPADRDPHPAGPRGRSGNSDALVKSILRGSSRFYFDGVVKIFKSGQNTNAFQSNPNLLLSSDARAESIPPSRSRRTTSPASTRQHRASTRRKILLALQGHPHPRDRDHHHGGLRRRARQRLPDERLQERFVPSSTGWPPPLRPPRID